MNKNEKKLLRAALKQLYECYGCTTSTRYFYHDDNQCIPSGKALAITVELVREHKAVEIVSVIDNAYWYADKIGEVFNVYEHDEENYILKIDVDKDRLSRRIINRNDCVVVGRFAEEDQP